MTAGANKTLSAALFGFCCAALVGTLYLVGAFEDLEMKALDARFRLIPGSASGLPDDIVIVTIDQNSLDYVSDEFRFGWPWPRAFYGKMIDFVSGAGAKALIFDMTFTEPDIDRLEIDGTDSDRELVRSTALSKKVYHAFVLKSQGLPPGKEANTALLNTLDKIEIGIRNQDRLIRFDAAALPSRELIEASHGLGFVNLVPEADNVVRRIPLITSWNGVAVPNIPLVAACNIMECPRIYLDEKNLIIGNTVIPVDSTGRAFLWWYRPENRSDRPFKYEAAANVFQSAMQSEMDEPTLLDRSAFKDKVVLFGSSATGLGDIKATPLDGAVPGVEIQATALANILRGDVVSRIGKGTVLVLLLAACLAVSLCSRMWKSVVPGTVALIVTSCLATLAGYRLLASEHLFLDVVPLFAGILTTFTTATLGNYVIERRHSKFVRTTFEHYLDRSVVKKLIADPAAVRLGGERKFCTVLYTDVAGFTGISERLTAEQVVSFMNLYLNEMTGIIVSHGGFVDKYVGDEIVAIFGAPSNLPNHAERTCSAILEMQKRIGEMQEEFAETGCKGEVFARTGAATGHIIVGNMGSDKRMNYTGMGDVMNLGARLEGVNKVYGTKVIISEKTCLEAGGGFVFRELDAVKVKGKEKGVKIYELVDRKETLSTKKNKALEVFSKGLARYRTGKWQEAKKLFSDGAAMNDLPSSVFLQRCREYAENPPPPGWDGVFVMKNK